MSSDMTCQRWLLYLIDVLQFRNTITRCVCHSKAVFGLCIVKKNTARNTEEQFYPLSVAVGTK